MPHPLTCGDGTSIALDNVHHAPFEEFVWENTSGQLLAAVFDQHSGNLFVGQSSGAVSVLHLNAGKPRLLGRHAGRVTGLCIRPWRSGITLIATCSADNTVKLWTHDDPRALQSSTPCLQTLHGHKAAVTCVAAVHECLVSGGTDGDVLLWKPEDNLLLQPSYQCVAKLWHSQHWVLSLACQLEPLDAGAAQGIFLAVAGHAVLRLQLSKNAVQVATAARLGSPVSTQPSTCSTTLLPAQPQLLSSQLATTPHNEKLCTPAAAQAPSPGASKITQNDPLGGNCRQGRMPNSNTCSSSSSNNIMQLSTWGASNSGSSHADLGCSTTGSQGPSVFAMEFIAQELAVLALAYDGCCRLLSAVDGSIRTCWKSLTGSCFTAVACTGPGSEVLLGDDAGMLQIYSLTTEKLIATKQVAHGRISCITCCGQGSRSSSRSGSASTRFAVAGPSSLDVWELRRDLQHGMLPTGHKLTVFAVQACQLNVQVGISYKTAAAPVPASPVLQSPPPSRLALPGQDAKVPQREQASAPCTATANLCAAEVAADQPPVPSSAEGRPRSRLQATKAFGALQPVATVAAGSSCGMLLSAGLDNCVLQWDVGCGQSILNSVNVAGVGSELSAMTFLQAWGILATGHDDGNVLLWRLDTGSHIALAPPGHNNTVSCLAPVATAKGDELLLSGGFDGAVCLWEPRHLRGLQPHMLTRFQAYGLSQEQLLAAHCLLRTGSSNGSRATSVPGRSRSAGGSAAAAVAGISYAGECADAGSRRLPSIRATLPDGQVVQSQRHLQRMQQPQSTLSLPHLMRGRLTGQKCSDSSSTAQPKQQHNSGDATHTQESVVLGTSTCGSGATAAIMEVPESPEVLVLLHDKEHEVVISGGNDGVVRVWSGACNGELLGQHLGHVGPVNCLAVDANFLFSGSSDTTVRVWDMLPTNFGSSSSAAGNGRQPRLARSSQVGSPATEMLCDVDTHQVADRIYVEALPSMTSGQEPQMSCAGGSSHAGSTCSALSKVQRAGLVTSSCPGAAQPKVFKGALSCPHSISFRILQGHTASVMGLAVVASNGLLVSVGRDGRLIQWDYINGSMLAQLHVQGEQLLCLSVQHGSGFVFAGTHGGQVLSFQLTAQMPCSDVLDEDNDVFSPLEAGSSSQAI